MCVFFVLFCFSFFWLVLALCYVTFYVDVIPVMVLVLLCSRGIILLRAQLLLVVVMFFVLRPMGWG